MKPDTYTAQGAWNAGAAAYQRGDSFESNPYDQQTDRLNWRMGWLNARRENRPLLAA